MSTSTPVMESAVTPLGEILVNAGQLTESQLAEALADQEQNGGKLGQVLVRRGVITELELAQSLSDQGRIPSVQLSPSFVDVEVAHRLGPEVSWNLNAIAINRIAGVTTVALDDPENAESIRLLTKHLGGDILPVYAGPGSIQECLDYLFPKGFQAPSDLEQLVEEAHVAATDDGDEELIANLSEDEGEQPAIQLINGILEDALAARASDVHMEARQDRFRVRFRVDGALLDRLSLPKTWMRPCMSRLKVMANLDIAQRRLPQDGRIQAEVQGKRVDLRVATSGTIHGEGAVIRVLDGGRRVFTLDQLGLGTEQLVRLQRIIDARDGFILATGPTGVGKTTTLYSILRRLNSPDRKLTTLEDPVENEIPGAEQISTNHKIGLTFATGLRALLRMDPDVIMVGEMRDVETARIAVQAALTGHLVLSTLATVGTAETITRLQDMGIERYLLADTIRGVVSQRLVRRICLECKVPVDPPRHLREALALEPGAGPFYTGKGCAACLNTGFKGRVGIYEILEMTPELYQLMSQRTSAGELRAAAKQMGMTTMLSQGLRKALAGETTLEEVWGTASWSVDR